MPAYSERLPACRPAWARRGAAPDALPSVTATSPNGTPTGALGCLLAAGPDAAGRYVFVPSSPVVLDPPGQPGSSCVLGFTFTVLKMPAFDALPANPGVQTAHVATVTAPTTRTSPGRPPSAASPRLSNSRTAAATTAIRMGLVPGDQPASSSGR